MKSPNWKTAQEIPPFWILWVYMSEYQTSGMEFKGAY